MSDDESRSGSEEWESDGASSRDDEDTEDEEEEEEGFDDEAAAALLLSAKNATDTGEGGGGGGGGGKGKGKGRARGAGKGKAKAEGEGKASGYAPSSYRGVFLSYGKWRATIRANYRNQYLGDYETEEEAAKAFDVAAKQLYENPVLNFLPDGSLNPDRKKSYFAQQLRTTGTALPQSCKKHKGKKPTLKTTPPPSVGTKRKKSTKAKAPKAEAKAGAGAAAAKAEAGGGAGSAGGSLASAGGGGGDDGAGMDDSKEGADYTGSAYRGVFFSYGKWRATIRSNHRNQHLGTFDSEEEAARAFDAAAKETYDKPILNFLPDGSLNPNRKQRVAAQRLQTKKDGPPPITKLKRLKTSTPSDYRGVYKSGDRWQAGISTNGRSQYLGTFDSEVEAAQAFDKAAQEMYESPILNFLPDGSVNPDRKKRLAAQKLKPGFAGLSGSDLDLGGSGPGSAGGASDDGGFALGGAGAGGEAMAAAPVLGKTSKGKKKRGAGGKEDEDSYWRPYASSRRRQRLAAEEQQQQAQEQEGEGQGMEVVTAEEAAAVVEGEEDPPAPLPLPVLLPIPPPPPLMPLPLPIPPPPPEMEVEVEAEAPQGQGQEGVNTDGVAEEAKEAQQVAAVEAAAAVPVAVAPMEPMMPLEPMDPMDEILETVAV